jgi:hypothetical protein
MMGGMGTPPDAGDASAAQGNTPSLPEPTGPCPVGTTSLWLKDTSRPDPWAAGVNIRELMVSLWYPAVPSDGRRARYMTPAEAELQLTSRGITGFRPDVLSMTRTNAVSDATPAGDITRAYVRAFFDQHLRGKPQSLLDQPSPRYPEVTFCSPETEPR